MMLIVLAIIIFCVYYFSNHGASGSNDYRKKALEILNERYASGQIGEVEYVSKRKLINDK